MKTRVIDTIQLREWEEARFPKERIALETAAVLIRDHDKHVVLDYPSPKTDGQWRLVPGSYVGILPVGQHTVLALEPKVPIENVFRMLEYAYDLRAFPWPEKTIHADSMAELFESVARVLARRIRDRTRKGLHRRYVGRTQQLPFVRGRMNLRAAHRLLWDPAVHCHFEEHTPDHGANQILLWTLLTTLRSGILSRAAAKEVGGAARALRGAVSAVPHTAEDCGRQHYDRLSHDYQPLHALCRFFLSQTGPSQRVGDHRMSPFLLKDGPVVRSIRGPVAEATPSAPTRSQDSRIRVVRSSRERSSTGWTLYSMSEAAGPLAVLDTKYKRSTLPQGSDVHQVVAYAVKKGLPGGHPDLSARAVEEPKEFFVGPVRVRTAGF